MSISTFASHLMLSLVGDKISYLIQGISSDDAPSIIHLNLKDEDDLKSLDELSEKHFTSVVLSTYSSKKTLVPEGIYESDKKESYINFNFGKEKSSGICTHDFVRQIDSYMVYMRNHNVQELLNRFPELQIINTASILLEAQIRSSIASQKVEATVYSENDRVDIIVSNKNKLLFCNSFHVHNPEDYTYYIVYVLDLLGISHQDTLIHLCGNTSKEKIKLLKKYCPKAGFHPFGYNKHLGSELSREKYAKNAVLLNQYQCV